MNKSILITIMFLYVLSIPVMAETSNVTVDKLYCGNMICEVGENPVNCHQDCKLSFTDYTSCALEPSMMCLSDDMKSSSQQILIVLLLVVAGIVIKLKMNKP